MISEMKSLILEEIIQSDQQVPTIEERNLLVIAFKNTLYEYSKAYRNLMSVLNRHENKGETHQVELTRKFAKMLQDKTVSYIYEINQIIDEILLVESLPLEDSVFYWKSKGDFFNYIRNVEYGYKISDWRANALQSYEKSYDLLSALPCTSSIRLGAILNYSVFCYDVSFDVEKAISIARPEYDLVMEHIQDLLEKQDEYDERNTILLIQLLRDNLTLWSSETEIGPDED